jgi:superfamily II DNA or RNA helicase
MSLSVQGSFVPHGAGGFFYLWALDPALAPGPAKGRGSGPHPQAAAADRLYPVLKGIPYVHGVTCVIRLPGPAGLKAAKVPGIAMSATAAAQWLLDLDAAFAGTGLAPARSLRAWSGAAKLLLELLGRGRFVPVLRAEAGCLAAAWAAAAPALEDATRLARLEETLPEVCRAIVPPDRDHKAYRPPTSGALLRRFLEVGAEALARLFLTEAPVPLIDKGTRAAAAYWLTALAGHSGRDLPPALPGGADLYAGVDQWAASSLGVRGHAGLRTGLRLVPPAGTESGDWELQLILQTGDDPPVDIPAEAAWAAMGRDIRVGDHRYSHAEQRLLADLPVMARLFTPLEPLRVEAAPTGVAVGEEAVVALLQEGAPALQQAGFPVQLPAGLVRSAAIQARMHLAPPAGVTDSQLGLSQLVDVKWDLALGDADVSLEEVQRLARLRRPLVLHRGNWVQVDPESLAAAMRHLDRYREKIDLATALRLAPDLKETTAEGWVAGLLTRLQEPARIEPVVTPAGFSGTLRPYQQRGFAWLAFLRRYGVGACLADDMGLGKTVQVIALLLHEREQGWTANPTLLVCPVSLVGNWRRELAKFAPGLKVLIHHGAGRAEAEGLAAAAPAHDVVITTYALCARDEAALAAVEWAGVVADEAQNLKNPATRHTQALRRIPAPYRIAMTGTPVENHLGDLWSLFQFLTPGLLGGPEEFRRQYAIPIERYRDAEAAARLRRHAGPLILRRVKTDPAIVDDLPEKQENSVVTNLTLEQASLYEAVVQETLERAESAAGIARHGAVLSGLTRLKQVCNHPAALTGDGGPLAGRSGKLDRLTEMLAEVLAEGDQALIFTQFATFGGRLRPYLQRHLGCEVLFMDGSTPQKERDQLVTRFQAGEAPVFLLSLKVGGVGLNLTAANHVFHFDRWWNPAVEDQATDRAFRIGQTKKVMVHKLVTAGTLEERIDRLLAGKRELSAQVVDTSEAWLSNLSNADLQSLITLARE